MLAKWKKIYKNNCFLINKIFKVNKILFLIRIIFAVLMSVSTLSTILLPKFLLEAMFSNDLHKIIAILLVYGSIILSISILENIYNNYNKISSEKMYLYIINEFLNKGISLDLSFYDNSESYSKYNRAFGNCCNVIESCNNTILSIITSFINIMMISSVLLWADLYIFIIVILFTQTSHMNKCLCTLKIQ